MRVLQGRSASWGGAPEASVVTVGVYDGVHLGHRAVLGRVLERAAELGVPAGVVTFDVHPLSVVAPHLAPGLLTTLEQRLEIFTGLGLDFTAVLAFEAEIRRLPPEGFAEQVLAGSLGARAVVVGEDFRFGRDRAGDVEILKSLGERLGFSVEPVPLVQEGERALSSSAIREHVAAGAMEEAARALGRWFELRGTVVRGEGRGRDLGIPTANLSLPEEVVLPARGVYAGYAPIGGRRVPAAINVGIRPMFPSQRDVVEAHLVGFEGSLYGETLTVGFHRRLREERTFDSVEELVAEMRRDIEQTLEVAAALS